MAIDVVHDAHGTQFELLVDGEHAGLIDYELHGQTLLITYAEVEPAQRKHGYGGILTQGALDQIRDTTTYRVSVDCPFVAAWIDEHPPYQELLTR